MKSKLIKVIILMITVILLLGTSQVFATIDPDFYEPESIPGSSDTLNQKVGAVLGVINVVGVVCSVVILGIVGIKYMLGSVEQKAEYKKTMLAYLVGAILLFSATTLPNMLYKIGTSIGEEAPSSSMPPKSDLGGPDAPTLN